MLILSSRPAMNLCMLWNWVQNSLWSQDFIFRSRHHHYESPLYSAYCTHGWPSSFTMSNFMVLQKVLSHLSNYLFWLFWNDYLFQVVKLVKFSAKRPTTMAIGDGANDVSMIQEAHIGLGKTVLIHSFFLQYYCIASCCNSCWQSPTLFWSALVV